MSRQAISQAQYVYDHTRPQYSIFVDEIESVTPSPIGAKSASVVAS